jgi:hypothetical protein
MVAIIGDGLAEPVGINLGKHKYRCRSAFGNRTYVRSWEGSACVHFASVFLVAVYGYAFDSFLQTVCVHAHVHNPPSDVEAADEAVLLVILAQARPRAGAAGSSRQHSRVQGRGGCALTASSADGRTGGRHAGSAAGDGVGGVGVATHYRRAVPHLDRRRHAAVHRARLAIEEHRAEPDGALQLVPCIGLGIAMVAYQTHMEGGSLEPTSASLVCELATPVYRRRAHTAGLSIERSAQVWEKHRLQRRLCTCIRTGPV